MRFSSTRLSDVLHGRGSRSGVRELRVVGNRHLGYHLKLKKLFGNCETVAGNAKFVILKAVRRGWR
jgi:16S rRNA (guanine1207-N2)-methyltransferase